MQETVGNGTGPAPRSDILFILRTLRLPIILCFVFCITMILPEQILEVYRYIALKVFETVGTTIARFHEAATLAAGALLVGLSFWAGSGHLLRAAQSDRPQKDRARWLTALLAIVPILAVALGMVEARIGGASEKFAKTVADGIALSFQRDQLEAAKLDRLVKDVAGSELAINANLAWIASGFVIFAALALVLFLLMANAPPIFGAKRSRAVSIFSTAAVILSPVLISLAFVAWPIGLARAVTPLGVICLFFAVLILTTSALSVLSERTNFPIISTTVVVAFVFALLGWNDNHKIRLVDAGSKNQGGAENDAGRQFSAWLAARQDKDLYETYPIYIVTAEGGGIYSAFRTATFLSNIEDQCPRFSHHVFAISSVSGGSIGAAIFSGLVEKTKRPEARFSPAKGCGNKIPGAEGFYYADAAEEILKEDFLSPVLSYFLFPDFLQRFIFFRVPSFDRARALETAFEEAWTTQLKSYKEDFPKVWAGGGNPLSEPFLSLWDPAGDTPALLINTTEIGSGKARVISPFFFETDQLIARPVLEKDGGTGALQDVRLSTAGVLSARFPWVTPAGWLDGSFRKNGQNWDRIHLVDGGYFDNSGVTAALALIEEIQKEFKAQGTVKKIEINLIVLSEAGFALEGTKYLTDMTSPFHALLSTRAARGKIAIEHAERLFKAESERREGSQPIAFRFSRVDLQGYGYPLPLGWRISPLTRNLILAENGVAERCQAGPSGGGGNNADCVVSAIVKDMSR